MSDSKPNDPPQTESEATDAVSDKTPSEGTAQREPVPHDHSPQAEAAPGATTNEQPVSERVTHDDLPQPDKPADAASESVSREPAPHDDLPRADTKQAATEPAPPDEPAKPGAAETSPAAEQSGTAGAPAAAAATGVDGAEAAAKPAAEAVATPAAETKPAAEAVASPAAAARATEAEDAQEVEPEIISLPRPKPKPASHHPPPPPSLRFKSVLEDASGPGAKLSEARFPVSGKPKLARDLMSRKLFTIEPNDTLEHLEEHMAAFRFRHLPVIDGDRLVGLITHRDLLHASSSFLSDRARERDEIIHKLPASRIMRTDLVTARPDTPLDQIAKQMWLKKIGCVLIIEQDGSLVGIITEADFIRLAHHFLVQPA